VTWGRSGPVGEGACGTVDSLSGRSDVLVGDFAEHLEGGRVLDGDVAVAGHG